jgi:cilia- and flagella-associated protein 53
LLEEQKRYREYLKAQYEEEKRKEKELDLIIEEDIERQFQKRLNEWKLQKQARKKLLESVLQERRLQIEEKSKHILILIKLKQMIKIN